MSNETFLNEEVAGVLGLLEPFKTVKVHVLNNEVETFQSMPVKLTIESMDGQLAKEIYVKTCPKKVTGNYTVEDWSQSKDAWEHLKNCKFAKPAKDGFVDLLIGVDNADYIILERTFEVLLVDPSLILVHLGGRVLVRQIQLSLGPM